MKNEKSGTIAIVAIVISATTILAVVSVLLLLLVTNSKKLPLMVRFIQRDVEREIDEYKSELQTTQREKEKKQAEAEYQKRINSGIVPVAYRKIGKHVYYSDDVFRVTATGEEKKAFKEYLKDADKTLTEDVVIGGYVYKKNDKKIKRVWGRGYANGALVSENTYESDQNNPDPNLDKKTVNVDVSTIDTKPGIKAKQYVSQVKELAEENKDRMVYEPGTGLTIWGSYELIYDSRKPVPLYYEFSICSNSYVRLDAKTGTVVGEYYDNGVVE